MVVGLLIYLFFLAAAYRVFIMEVLSCTVQSMIFICSVSEHPWFCLPKHQVHGNPIFNYIHGLGVAKLIDQIPKLSHLDDYSLLSFRR